MWKEEQAKRLADARRAEETRKQEELRPWIEKW